jgi:hypothetical protein
MRTPVASLAHGIVSCFSLFSQPFPKNSFNHEATYPKILLGKGWGAVDPQEAVGLASLWQLRRPGISEVTI